MPAKVKIIMSFFFTVFVLLTTNSCLQKNTTTLKNKSHPLDNICQMINSKWSAYALREEEKDLNCEKENCRGRQIGLMKLNCKNNKIVGKHFIGLSSEFGKEYWNNVSSLGEEDKITLTIQKYYNSEKKEKLVWKKVYEIEDVKNDKLFGNHYIYLNIPKRIVENQKFVAIKTK